MTNDNCLEGIQCPKCGQEDRFKIAATITCVVTDDGSEPTGDHHWDDDSLTHCCNCGFHGTLTAFRFVPQLPPDPDGMNGERSAWAANAIKTFMAMTGTDEEEALADLLADLMHWCDRNAYDFKLALDRAHFHYEVETGAEPS